MQHRGKIIEAAVRESGISISKLCELMGKSRRWMYLVFENEKVPLDYVFKIGQIIKHDFTEELNDLRYLANQHDFQKETPEQVDNYLYWKIKYYELLEEYFQLSRKAIQSRVSNRKN